MALMDNHIKEFPTEIINITGKMNEILLKKVVSIKQISKVIKIRKLKYLTGAWKHLLKTSQGTLDIKINTVFIFRKTVKKKCSMNISSLRHIVRAEVGRARQINQELINSRHPIAKTKWKKLMHKLVVHLNNRWGISKFHLNTKIK